MKVTNNLGSKVIYNDMYGFFSPYVDEFGNAVKRTKDEYSYSYDGFVTHRMGANKEANSTIYSDRLLQQNHKKCRSLMEKHFGNSGDYWFDRQPNQNKSKLFCVIGVKTLN